MSPRQPINAVAYAFRAGIADSLAGGIPEATGDTMIAHWDSIRNIPADIMQEGEDISLLNNDANYIDTVITDSTLSGNGAISPLSLAQRGATDGQVLKWSEDSWRPADDESSGATDAIINQNDSIQVAEFDISGKGEVGYMRLKPNTAEAFDSPTAGTFATYGIDENFKVLVYNGECWREVFYSDTCTIAGCSECIDYDGNGYLTVQIGDQCWMAENLKTTHYRDGTPIDHVTDNTEWENLDDTETGAYCAYDNDPANIETYGLLYNWYAVNNAQGLCPDGWHVPTDEEWKTLEMYLGMSEVDADIEGWRGTNEGSKLAGRAELWNDGDLETDPEFGTSGFSALPGGSRGLEGNFTSIGFYTNFWSSSEFSSTNVWHRLSIYNRNDLARGKLTKQYGRSIRCVSGDYPPLYLEIEEPSSDTIYFDDACTLTVIPTGGALPYEYDWNIDGTGDWDDEATLIFTVTEECDTIICQIRDDEMTIAADTIIIYGVFPSCGIVTDYDGNEYLTVQIGEQCWMAENLKTTHYRDGTPIDHVTDNTEWSGLSSGAYCAYDNDPANIDTYGLLYNWYAVNNAQGLCPDGWHIPTDEEWKTLEMYLGMSETEADDTDYRGTNEGSKLAGRADLWNDGDLEADPEFGTSGFMALPGGYRNNHGDYYSITYLANFCSSSEFSSTYVWVHHLNSFYTGVNRYYFTKRHGFSVRCVESYDPLHLEIEEPSNDTICFDDACTLTVNHEGGAAPYEYDWNIDGTGDWDDEATLIFTVTEECDTIICQIRDDEMTIAADTIIIYGEFPSCGIVTDYDGNEYETIILGDQCWMRENLKTTHYRDGTPISTGFSDTEWEHLDETETSAYAEYNDDPSNVETYGRLYNWYAVDDVHGLCPDGWHVPTDREWKTLEMYLGMSEAATDSTAFRGTNEGSKLASRADLWADGDLEADPEFGTSGFTALPGGYRSYYGDYRHITTYAFFWTSSEYSSSSAWRRYIIGSHTDIHRYDYTKLYGFSVRCLRGYAPLLLEIEEPSNDTICFDDACTLTVNHEGGAAPYEYDWNIDGTGDWDDEATLIFTVTEECDTIICQIRDDEMTIAADTIIIYGEDCIGCGRITDYDGNVYETIVLGTQCWMRENLKTTHYRDGSSIYNMTDNTDWTNLANTETGGYCDYSNDPSNSETYGRLYNWYATTDSRGLCPDGWHVPTDKEWIELEIHLGMSEFAANDASWRETNEGSQLAGDASMWYDGALETNPEFGSSGFDALPAGRRGAAGFFSDFTYYNYFWSSTMGDAAFGYEPLAWYRHIVFSDSTVLRSWDPVNYGYSIRCVEGEQPLQACIWRAPSTEQCRFAVCSLKVTTIGGTGPYEYDWNIDGTGDWDDDDTLKLILADASYTIICNVRDADMNIDADTVDFTTDSCDCGTVTDIDGNEYQTIKIGHHCWFKENLKTTHYRDGTAISHVTGNTAWVDLETTETGAYCEYNNDPANVEIYGRIYNWYAVDDSRGLCPTGWHVPTDEEWQNLELALGMSEGDLTIPGERGTNEGSKLATRADLWNDGALDSDPEFGVSGFDAVPGGMRNGFGMYVERWSNAGFWTSTWHETVYSWLRFIDYEDTYIHRSFADEFIGMSVRCIKD